MLKKLSVLLGSLLVILALVACGGSSDNEENVDAIQREGFTDYPIIVGEGTDFPLNGILSMPDDASGQVPGVVIVSGSGPNDMDGTLGGNTIYRDMAEFLAANGIAVIRYDRRLFAHEAKTFQQFGGSLTAQEEVIDDVILATELLKADSRIDENDVFMIGHSLGGQLAPRLHTAGGDFAGLIMMATGPRPISELFIEQTRASIFTGIEEGVVTEADMAELIAEVDNAEELFNTMADMPDDVARETYSSLFPPSIYYFKHLEAHPFEAYVQDVTIPMLVMHAGRDFQVIDVDFALMQEILAGRDNVTFKLYEDLNHVFLPSTATNFLEHANEVVGVVNTGHVYTPALQDLVDWILK
jgi:dienelactone hydrolase